MQNDTELPGVADAGAEVHALNVLARLVIEAPVAEPIAVGDRSADAELAISPDPSGFGV